MKIQYLGRNEFITEIPALTQAGEEFCLSGNQFARGSIGQIIQVLAQSGGVTRVRVRVVKGRVMSRGQATIQANSRRHYREDDEKPDVDPSTLRNEAQLFEQGSAPLQRVGGSAYWDDFDPRPRRGVDSVPVNSPQPYPQQPGQLPQQVSLVSQGYVAPVEIMPDNVQINSVAFQIASVNSQPRGTSSDFVSAEELAIGMGRNVSRRGGVSGGRRGSFSNDKVGSMAAQLLAEHPKSRKG